MRITYSLVLSLVLALGASATTEAQDGAADPLRLEGGPSPSMTRPLPSAAELRQRRALARQRQRDARMQANAWAGYHPLRPTLSADPYVQLRRPAYRTIYGWPVWSYAGHR